MGWPVILPPAPPVNRQGTHIYKVRKMSDAHLELPDSAEPEAIRLHSALAVAILALELIQDTPAGAEPMARAALGHLYRRHPVSRHLFGPERPESAPSY